MAVATFNFRLVQVGRSAVLAGCLLATVLGVAQAATSTDDVAKVAVYYGDLDVSTSAGASTLYQRIANAARQVCPYEDAVELDRIVFNQKCRREAIARAVRDINSPQLALVYANRVKRG